MNKNTITVILALVPVLIILTSTFSSDVANFFLKKENAFNIPLKEKILNDNLISYYNIQEYINENLFVPNYDSRITIKEDPQTNPDKSIRFQVKIEDDGILPMDKPYFYVYLLDPNKRVRGCFPDCDFSDRNLEGWATAPFFQNGTNFVLINSSSDLSLDSGKENSRDNIAVRYLLPYQIKNYDFDFYPESLAAGSGQLLYKQKNRYILSKQQYTYYYTFPSDMTGDWEVYVFSLNDVYMDRKGQPIYNESNSAVKKLINYEKQKIVVLPKEKETLMTFFDSHIETTLRIFKVIAAIIGSILTFRTLYYLINKYYKKIIGFIDSSDIQKRIYLALIVILLALLLVQYLIMRS